MYNKEKSFVYLISQATKCIHCMRKLPSFSVNRREITRKPTKFLIKLFNAVTFWIPTRRKCTIKKKVLSAAS